MPPGHCLGFNQCLSKQKRRSTYGGLLSHMASPSHPPFLGFSMKSTNHWMDSPTGSSMFGLSWKMWFVVENPTIYGKPYYQCCTWPIPSRASAPGFGRGPAMSEWDPLLLSLVRLVRLVDRKGRHPKIGWWFGTSILYFPIQLGISSSQLTFIKFSEGFKQPPTRKCMQEDVNIMIADDLDTPIP